MYRNHQYTFGIVLIRLAGLAATDKAEIVASVVESHAEKLPYAFTVISLNNVRIRSRLL